MDSLFAIGVIVTITYLLAQFTRQEAVEEFYEAVIIDVEGRLDWATSRPTYPFSMQADIDAASKFLHQAKKLWRANKYPQAYQIARESQQAMDKAQNIYISVQVKNSNRVCNNTVVFA